MAAPLDLVRTLPEGPSNKIFSFLGCLDLDKCRQVSWEWRHLANDHMNWEALARTFAMPSAMPSLTLRQLQRLGLAYEFRMLSSNLEVVNKIANFVSRINLGQNGVFRCFIGTGGAGLECITLAIQGSRQSIQEGRVDMREDHRIRTIGRGEIGLPENLHIHARFIPCPNYISLRMEQASTNELRGSFTRYHSDRFEARLTFPLIQLGFQTEMETKIRNIMIRKLTLFDYDYKNELDGCVIA